MTDPHHDAQSGHVPGTPVHDQYAATAAYPQGHVGSLGGPFQDGVPLAGSASATEGAGAPIPMGSPVPAAAPAASQQPAAPAVPQAPAASSAPPAGAPGLAQPPGAPGSPWLQGQQAPQAQPSGGVGYPQVGYPGDASAPAVGRPAGHPATGGSPSGHPSGYHQTSPYTSYPGHPQGAGPAQPAYQPSAVSAQQPSAYQAVPASPYQAAPAYQQALQPSAASAQLPPYQGAALPAAGTGQPWAAPPAQAPQPSHPAPAPAARRTRGPSIVMGVGVLLILAGLVIMTWSYWTYFNAESAFTEISATGAVRAELSAGEEYGLYHTSGEPPQCTVSDPDGQEVRIIDRHDVKVHDYLHFATFKAEASGSHVISCESSPGDSVWASMLINRGDIEHTPMIFFFGAALALVGFVPVIVGSVVRMRRNRAFLRALAASSAPGGPGQFHPGP